MRALLPVLRRWSLLVLRRNLLRALLPVLWRELLMRLVLMELRVACVLGTFVSVVGVQPLSAEAAFDGQSIDFLSAVWTFLGLFFHI